MTISTDNDINLKYLFSKLKITSKTEQSWATATEQSFDAFYRTQARKQPISSFIRAMELRCRAMSPILHSFFKIDYEYVEYCPKIGSCMLDQYGSRFLITLPLKYEKEEFEDDVRTIIAHEVGHLYTSIQLMEQTYTEVQREKNPKDCRDFILDNLNSETRKGFVNNDNRASIIGVFTLNRRSLFYKHKLEEEKRKFCKPFEKIVDSFEELKNKRVKK
jgi:hypothetical protein